VAIAIKPRDGILCLKTVPEGMAGSNFYGEETGNAFPVKIKQQQDNDEPNQR